MNAGEREGLRDIIDAHFYDTGWRCSCGWVGTADRWSVHVETAVLDWLRARLASDEVREAAREAVMDAWSLNVAERNGWDTAAAHGRGMSDAALAAVVGALAGAGNADSAHEAARNGARSDERPERDQLRQGRDDEGRSGARDGSGL